MPTIIDNIKAAGTSLVEVDTPHPARSAAVMLAHNRIDKTFLFITFLLDLYRLIEMFVGNYIP